jgi:hypothetical protein
VRSFVLAHALNLSDLVLKPPPLPPGLFTPFSDESIIAYLRSRPPDSLINQEWFSFVIERDSVHVAMVFLESALQSTQVLAPSIFRVYQYVLNHSAFEPRQFPPAVWQKIAKLYPGTVRRPGPPGLREVLSPGDRLRLLGCADFKGEELRKLLFETSEPTVISDFLMNASRNEWPVHVRDPAVWRSIASRIAAPTLAPPARAVLGIALIGNHICLPELIRPLDPTVCEFLAVIIKDVTQQWGLPEFPLPVNEALCPMYWEIFRDSDSMRAKVEAGTDPVYTLFALVNMGSSIEDIETSLEALGGDGSLEVIDIIEKDLINLLPSSISRRALKFVSWGILTCHGDRMPFPDGLKQVDIPLMVALSVYLCNTHCIRFKFPDLAFLPEVIDIMTDWDEIVCRLPFMDEMHLRAFHLIIRLCAAADVTWFRPLIGTDGFLCLARLFGGLYRLDHWKTMPEFPAAVCLLVYGKTPERDDNWYYFEKNTPIGSHIFEIFFLFWKEHQDLDFEFGTVDRSGGQGQAPEGLAQILFGSSREVLEFARRGGLPAHQVVDSISPSIFLRNLTWELEMENPHIDPFLMVLANDRHLSESLSVETLVRFVSLTNDFGELFKVIRHAFSDSNTQFRWYCHELEHCCSDLVVGTDRIWCPSNYLTDEPFIDALRLVYERSFCSGILFRTFNSPAYRAPSEKAFRFVSLLMQSPNPSQLTFLSLLAITCPFLIFENPTFNSSLFIEKFIRDSDFTTTEAATFLFTLSLTPSFADDFLHYVFAHLLDVSCEVCTSLLAVLDALGEVHSFQHIMFGLMLRYEWPALAISLLEKYKRDGIEWLILDVSLFYVQSVANRRTGIFASGVVISEIDRPFSKLCQTGPYFLAETRLSPGAILSSQPTLFDTALGTLRLDAARKSFERNQIQDLMPYFPDVLPCPPLVPPDFFSALDGATQASVIYDSIPKLIKRPTAQVFRILLKYPAWVTGWLSKRPRSLLHARQYSLLMEAIEEINTVPLNLEPCDAPDAGLALLFSRSFFETILQLPPTASLQKLVENIAASVPWRSLLQRHVSELLNSDISRARLASLVPILRVTFVDTGELCAAAIRLNMRSDRTIPPRVLKILERTRVPLDRRVFDYLEVLLIESSACEIHDFLPRIQVLGLDELPTLLSHVFEALARNGPTDKISRFVEHVRGSDFIRMHEGLILELMTTLISKQSRDNERLIDDLFMCLGTDRNDCPRPNHFSDSYREKLPPFWQFIYDHREFIRSRIKARPRLLHVTYSFLGSARRLLCFRTRASFLKKSLSMRQTNKIVQISVRRAQVLEDSFRQLLCQSPAIWLGSWRINFLNEDGVDGGGLLREWFTIVTGQLFDPHWALFLPTVSGRSFQPNPGSHTNSEHLQYFDFAGRFFAIALMNRINLAAHLAIPFLKQLVGDDITLNDLEDIDSKLYSAMGWLLNNSVENFPSELMFVADEQQVGVHQEVELKPGGASIPVTDENKMEFVELMVDHVLKRRIEPQITAFAVAFYSLVPREDISILDAKELDVMICGEDLIDVDDWFKNCTFCEHYSKDHPVIQRFFQVIRKWSQEDLAKLLLFITGCSRVPFGGFRRFYESGVPIQIQRDPDSDRLIHAHTCANTLSLPEYKTEDEMNEKLMYAVTNCTEYGFH